MSERPPPSFDPAIKAYYDRAPEENRLEQGTSQLEQLRSRELILRHAPAPPSVVLDVGGGAGPYAFWLAEQGHDVRLLDATPRLVDIARVRNENAAHPLAFCGVADARKLPDANESAGMVLLLGPLYHLQEAADRQTALAEAARVLRPGGVLIAAAISRWASALDGLSREILRSREFARIVDEDLIHGRHYNTTDRVDYFTTAYFHRPEELRGEVLEAGFDVEELYGIEGPGWILPDFDDRWNDAERRELLTRVARALETEPSLIGSSAHLMVVGRKPRR
ncbi:MAG: class I SAM-dependent methyltransferase [Gemmatimonadaceae bacterium]